VTALTPEQLLDILSQADRSSSFFANASGLLDELLRREASRIQCSAVLLPEKL
jgi:hypothetical protein